MNKFFLKIFMALNTFAIRLSHGRLGSQLGAQTILLLHSRGRRSGRQYVTPVAYFFTDGFYFLIGSNWGKEHNADWYNNLLAQPRATIEVKGQLIPVEAVPAKGPQYDRLWEYAVHHHPAYIRYKEMTRRRIPIMVLQPLNP
jgi:deazaflavin-dependent oxidoreductase (nitroreductase family)